MMRVKDHGLVGKEGVGGVLRQDGEQLSPGCMGRIAS